MAIETNQVVQNSSTPAPTNAAAGNNITVATSGGTPTATPVMARRGLRQTLQEMLQGWQTVIPGGTTMQSSGSSLSQSAVLEQLQAYLAVYTTQDAQVTSLKKTRAQLRAQRVEASQLCDRLKLAVTSYFNPTDPQLAQFGIPGKKARRQLTSQQLAVKAAKAMATRVLRGTTSKKKKALVKSGPMQVTVGPAEQGAQSSAPMGSTSASPPVVSK